MIQSVPVKNNELGLANDLLEPEPCMKRVERIAPNDEVEAIVRMQILQDRDRFNHVRRARSAHLDVRHLEEGIPLYRPFRHLQTVGGGGQRRIGFVRRPTGWYPKHAIEGRMNTRRFGDDKMRQVGWIECTAE